MRFRIKGQKSLYLVRVNDPDLHQNFNVPVRAKTSNEAEQAVKRRNENLTIISTRKHKRERIDAPPLDSESESDSGLEL